MIKCSITQFSLLDDASEELSPEKPIQETNKYQLTPTLLPTTPSRRLQDVHSYYIKQSISPLSNNDEELFEDFEDLKIINNKNYDHLVTGSNSCPNLTDSRFKSLEQYQFSQYMLYYKSNQKISIPRASLFKIQHLTEERLKLLNNTINSCEQQQE